MTLTPNFTRDYCIMAKFISKPTWCICEQHGSRPACASAQSDQGSCCSLTNSITSRETDSEQHGSLSVCTDAQADLDPCLSQTHYVVFYGAAQLFNNRNLLKYIIALKCIVFFTNAFLFLVGFNSQNI
jgi:hypothetical protein